MSVSIGWIVHPSDIDPRLIEALAKAGVNELGVHPGGGRMAGALMKQTLSFWLSVRGQALRALCESHGLKVECDAHVLSYLLPREEFSRHPEWFRMDEDGKRNPDSNLCASSPEALAFLEKRAYELGQKLYTPSHRYPWWPDDVRGCACHCPACRSYTKAEQALLITNAIARGVKRADPMGTVGYLAYQDTLETPRRVTPEKGVYLEFAPIDRLSDTAIDDAGCEENARQISNLPALLDLFGRENARVLEYWVDNSLFSNWRRPPVPFQLNKEVLRRDVAYYRRAGFQNYTSFACYLGPDYAAAYGEIPIEQYADIIRQTGEA